MVTSISNCDDGCISGIARRSMQLGSLRDALTISTIPFLLTFILVAVVSWQKLFPLLSGRTRNDGSKGFPSGHNGVSQSTRSRSSLAVWAVLALDRAAAFTFSTTIALSAVLAELIFCEIANIVNPATRGVALEATIAILLVSLVVVTPALEIHVFTAAIGISDSTSGRARLWVGLLFDAVGLSAWLACFWWVGEAILRDTGARATEDKGFSKGSLERIGVIGISLMALLAGFAAISSIWQTFGVKHRTVTDSDIARKKTGLDTTTELLGVKESRLRALEHKLSDAPQGQSSFFNRVVGTFRGNPDTYELSALRMEISGLETMQATLSNSLTLMQSRHAAQQRATTAYGRACLSASYLFALYCVYRICTATAALVRRFAFSSTKLESTDPINNVLALLAKHWDPTLDRAAWARSLTFLLSGGMLLASFNAVLQTVLLFSRFAPARAMHSARQSLALLVSQICATYVVSSALLLRSNLPREMGSWIEGVFGGAPLDPGFVERWFEGWFLGACAVTAAGIWVGKSFAGPGELDEDYLEERDMEQGKRS